MAEFGKSFGWRNFTRTYKRKYFPCPPQKAKKRFPEKLLRQWTPLSPENQLAQFEEKSSKSSSDV